MQARSSNVVVPGGDLAGLGAPRGGRDQDGPHGIGAQTRTFEHPAQTTEESPKDLSGRVLSRLESQFADLFG